jgi:PPOX class probable F420-dependent enzyme
MIVRGTGITDRSFENGASTVPNRMSDEEVRAFLTQGTRTGKLATTRPDGRPHVAPIWFVLDGNDVVFMTGSGTVKGRSLLNDPRVSLVVDLEEPPYAFVIVEGVVTVSEDLDKMLGHSIAIARRYMGEELAEEYGRRNAVEGELLLRLPMDHVIAMADVSGH